MASPVDILLVGYGAVGAIYAYILIQSQRAHVTVVARGNFDAVQANGMTIKSEIFGNVKGFRPYRTVRSVHEAADRPYAYVVITTKSLPELSPTSTTLAPLLSESYAFKQPIYVLLQNGMSVEKDLYLKALERGAPKILSAASYIDTNLRGAGDVVEHGHVLRLRLGVYRPPTGKLVLKNTAEEEGLLKGFEEIVTAGGGRVEIVPDVQPVKFAKNLWNTSFAAASTLIRAPLPTFFATKETRDRIISVVRNLLREAVDVARAVGYTEDVVPSSLIEWNIQDNETRNGLGTTSTHRPSMLVDLESGKPLELEVVVGEVVRMGREKNVAIPTLETVYGLLSVVQNNLIRESAK